MQFHCCFDHYYYLLYYQWVRFSTALAFNNKHCSNLNCPFKRLTSNRNRENTWNIFPVFSGILRVLINLLWNIFETLFDCVKIINFKFLCFERFWTPATELPLSFNNKVSCSLTLYLTVKHNETQFESSRI